VQLDPKVVETGARADPEPASKAAARGYLTLKGGSGSYTVKVQQRTPGGAWSTIRTGSLSSGGRLFFNGRRKLEYRGVAVIPDDPNVVSPVESYDWTAVFTDQFSNPGVNPGWALRHHVNTQSSQAWQAIEQVGGALTMRTLQDPAYDDCGNPPDGGSCHVLTAMVGTTERWAPTASTPLWIAARVRFHEGRGAHSAFWLASGYGPGQAELDVAEWFGRGSNEQLWSNVYYARGDGPDREDAACDPDYRCERATTALSWLPAGENWWDSWHILAARWTTTAYHVYIDGVHRFTLDEHVGTEPAQIVLSHLTEDWENVHLDLGLPGRYVTRFDWVRVFAPASPGAG
jgi:hypothetical protein